MVRMTVPNTVAGNDGIRPPKQGSGAAGGSCPPMTRSFRVSTSARQTEAIGAELAGRLEPGQVVLVEGELGAGKTTLVRGACRALGVTAPVRSPTFTIGHRYPGRVEVAHVDLFRVGDLRQEDPDLLADYLDGTTISFVEWPQSPDQLSALANIAARVRIEHAGGDQRRLEIELT
jgi:tRNA threonylcarbamoyladenosine biosynthesis protein TsaE